MIFEVTQKINDIKTLQDIKEHLHDNTRQFGSSIEFHQNEGNFFIASI